MNVFVEKQYQKLKDSNEYLASLLLVLHLHYFFLLQMSVFPFMGLCFLPLSVLRRTAPHLHMSEEGEGGRVRTDDSQERKSWDSIRGRLPLTARDPQNNQVVCGSERPKVMNRTCFPLLKCLTEEALGGGDNIL